MDQAFVAKAAGAIHGGKKVHVDVGEDTTAGDGDGLAEAVQLLVVEEGELNVAGGDAGPGM